MAFRDVGLRDRAEGPSLSWRVVSLSVRVDWLQLALGGLLASFLPPPRLPGCYSSVLLPPAQHGPRAPHSRARAGALRTPTGALHPDLGGERHPSSMDRETEARTGGWGRAGAVGWGKTMFGGARPSPMGALGARCPAEPAGVPFQAALSQGGSLSHARHLMLLLSGG